MFVSVQSFIHPVLVKDSRSGEVRDWLFLETKVSYSFNVLIILCNNKMARSTLSSTIFLSAINFSETFQLQLLIKDSLTDLQLLGKFLGSQVEESVFDLVILSPTRRCQPKHNGLYLTHQRLPLMRTC